MAATQTHTPMFRLPSLARYGRLMCLMALLLVRMYPAQAQPAPLDAATRQAVVTRIADLVNQHYVFPDVAEATGRHLRQQLDAGAFAPLTDPLSFAQALTRTVQEVNHDKHMRIRVTPPDAGGPGRNNPLVEQVRFEQSRKAGNHGFREVKVLEGNIGYLDLRQFAPPERARETAVAALHLLANVDALIVDVRQNGGGSPEMVRLLCSYFFGPNVHLNSLYWREGNRTEEFWTLDQVEGTRLPDLPLFVLTSSFTFSAAEEFTYNLQTRQRATIVGETTGGGANPGGLFPINDQFSIFIPTGQAINPVTGTNWEGTGVKPDVAVPGSEALERALPLARVAATAHHEATLARQETALQALQTRLDEAARLAQSSDARAEQQIRATLQQAQAIGLLDEQAINLLGYHYLGNDETVMALAVFVFNAQAYPQSANVYDSLGEAQMKAGHQPQAIANYQKSLELDPRNENARQMLARMGVAPDKR